MTKDKTPAAADTTGNELQQFKIYLEKKYVDKLEILASKSGLRKTMKAKMILVEYLNNLKD